MKSLFIALSLLCATCLVHAKPNANLHTTTHKQLFRQSCALPISHKVLEINNIRMQLSTNGDTWWDTTMPCVAFKFDATKAPVAALFATGIWAGGVDAGGNLKMACSTYRANGNDWFAGPLDENTGTTTLTDCLNWDKHFSASKANIENFIQLYSTEPRDTDGNIIDKQGFLAKIGDDIKGWPAVGNPFFKTIHGFDLPENKTFLAAFYDGNFDGQYNPINGDYPIYPNTYSSSIIGDITFWIFNDEGSGANHTASKGQSIRMEVQAYTFFHAKGIVLEDMENTIFQAYNYIYKGAESIDSTYLAYWVDPAIGCEDDDYIGFDRFGDRGEDYNYMYAYNADTFDGNTTCAGYGEHSPIITISDLTDYNSLKFFFPTLHSSFMYYVNGSADASLPEAMSDPTQAIDYYRLMNQRWKDGTPLTSGGSGYRLAYGLNEITDIPFTAAPNDKNGWSMMNANLSPKGDYRMLSCGGPMQFRPGSVFETEYAITAVPNQGGGAVDLTRTRLAVDNARRYIDQVFYRGIFEQGYNSPSAPTVNTVSSDKAVTLNIENTPPKYFNNFDYDKANVIPYYYSFTPTGKDSFYRFEGYLVYQLQKDTFYKEGMEDDINLMRLVAQCDIKNGITALTNWTPQYDITSFNQYKYIPTIKVKDTNDNGIIRSFTLTEDAFTKTPLVNDKPYYYVVLAYAQNNFKTFDPNTGLGQRSPFVSSPANSVKTIKVTPHKSSSVFSVGETIPITRLDGVGLGDNFLEFQDSMYAKILKAKYIPEITYKAGQGPFTLKVSDPEVVQKGKYSIWLSDSDPTNNVLEKNAKWNFQKEGDAQIVSNNSIDFFNEQILLNYGLAIGIGQTPEVGESPFTTMSNGVIEPKVATSKKVEYKDYSKPLWFDAIKNNSSDGLDFIPTDLGQKFYQRDPNQQLSNQIADGLFVPYSLCAAEQGAVSPELRAPQNQNFTRQASIFQLNNVDIVLTSDKSKWSRCIVVETFNKLYGEEGLQAQGYTDGSIANMGLRKGLSVGSDTDPDAPSDGTTGKSWFPGYAIDVETGKRLAVFFGENSAFDVKNNPILDTLYTFSQLPTGSDMIWNPTSDKILISKDGTPQNNNAAKIAGGGHYIYVTDLPYDDWQILYNDASDISNTSKVKTIRNVRWTTAPILSKGTNLLSYAEGLIPNEVKFKLRVQNPYAPYNGVGTHNGYPSYVFWIGDKTVSSVTPPQSALSNSSLLIFPNPSSQAVHVKTEEAIIEKISIFSIDGKLMQSLRFDKKQALHQWTWDLKDGLGGNTPNGIYIISVLTDKGLLQQKCIINKN